MMKKSLQSICFLTLMIFGPAAYTQVYKTADDTVKLNKEYTEVSNDIASITAKLTIARNNSAEYQSRLKKANEHAQDAATSSSVQAAKATNGNVKDARKAKRNAKKAFKEAKDARSAEHDLSDNDKIITALKGHLAQKQERLSQLEAMRDAINGLTPQQ